MNSTEKITETIFDEMKNEYNNFILSFDDLIVSLKEYNTELETIRSYK